MASVMEIVEPLDIQVSRHEAEKRVLYWRTILKSLGYADTHGLYIRVIRMQTHVFVWGIYVAPHNP
jgi:hypothetical protein